ncbi:MAG: hypothetical protein Q8M00_00105 [bacterium]|nr:hypothetical protein [bacterium]
MKKIVLSLTLISFLVFPALAFAQPPATVDIMATLDGIVDWVFGILVIFAAIMLVWAGFSFITAGGDATKLGEARQKILYALIGIIVAFASRGLIAFVQTLVK